MKIIRTEKAPKALGPKNKAVLKGNMLFTSGQLGIDPVTGKLVEGGVEKQAEQVMENLGAILQESGLDFRHVVKATIYMTNLANFSIINSIYGRYFNELAPARETSQVCALPLSAELEISMVAVKD
jgi:2-iminobutanoate/2-iminopropanoate deaminase